MNIIKNNLNIDARPGDIDRSRRLGPKSRTDRPRGMIIKFANYNIRDLVFKAKRRLKGTTLKMLIVGSLTAKRVKLLDDLRKKYKDKLEASWTQDGRLYLLSKTSERTVINKSDKSDAKKLRF